MAKKLLWRLVVAATPIYFIVGCIDCNYTLQDVKDWESKKDIRSLNEATNLVCIFSSEESATAHVAASNEAFAARDRLVLEHIKDCGINKVIVKVREEKINSRWDWPDWRETKWSSTNESKMGVTTGVAAWIGSRIKECLKQEMLWKEGRGGLTLTAIEEHRLGWTGRGGEFGDTDTSPIRVGKVVQESRSSVRCYFSIDIGSIKGVEVGGLLQEKLRKAVNK